MHNLSTIIVAGGNGSRMNSEIPKQFLSIEGEPVLMRTIRNFDDAVREISKWDCKQFKVINNIIHNIILVLPDNFTGLWKDLCKKHNFTLPHTLVAGGKTRFESVKAGLAQTKEADIIAVHDGVRPFFSAKMIAEAIKTTIEKGSAIPALPPNDSLRKLTPEGNMAVDRSDYRIIQTPQIFNAEWIKSAYRQEYDEKFTDDATVLERAGYKITLIIGEAGNFKITTPKDLLVAETVCRLDKSNRL